MSLILSEPNGRVGLRRATDGSEFLTRPSDQRMIAELHLSYVGEGWESSLECSLGGHLVLGLPAAAGGCLLLVTPVREAFQRCPFRRFEGVAGPYSHPL